MEQLKKLVDTHEIVGTEFDQFSLTVTFKKVDYIRVGSYTKKLMDVPSMKAQLWDKIRSNKFEDLYALQDLEASEALNKLDYNIYFELKNIPMPTNQDGLLHYMLEEDIRSPVTIY